MRFINTLSRSLTSELVDAVILSCVAMSTAVLYTIQFTRRSHDLVSSPRHISVDAILVQLVGIPIVVV